MLNGLNPNDITKFEEEWRVHDRQRSELAEENSSPQEVTLEISVIWRNTKDELIRLRQEAIDTTIADIDNHLRDEITRDNPRRLPKSILKKDLLKKAAVTIAHYGFVNAAREVAQNSTHPSTVKHFLVGGSLECPTMDIADFDAVRKFFEDVKDRLHPKFSPEILIQAYESIEPFTAILRRIPSKPIKAVGGAKVFFEELVA
jgi:hypothetical protein